MAPLGSFECLVPSHWNYLRRIRRCGLVGVVVFLLEEVRHWVWVVRFQKPTLGPGSLSACSLWIRCKLSVTAPLPLLLACCCVPCHDAHGLTLWLSASSQLNVYLYRLHWSRYLFRAIEESLRQAETKLTISLMETKSMIEGYRNAVVRLLSN
jgi:hypothetical protein